MLIEGLKVLCSSVLLSCPLQSSELFFMALMTETKLTLDSGEFKASGFEGILTVVSGYGNTWLTSWNA